MDFNISCVTIKIKKYNGDDDILILLAKYIHILNAIAHIKHFKESDFTKLKCK